MSTPRRSARAAAACCAITLLCSCGSSGSSPKAVSTTAHVVTTGQADRLAVSRFLNYESGGVHFSTHLVANQTSLAIAGDVDYRNRVGYAELSGAGSSFTVQWNATELLAWPAQAAATTPPALLPATKPSARRLAPSTSDIDSLLAVLLSLGQDRPDNAQLIRQDGARWLRTDTVGGTRVDVIAGPPATAGAATTGAAPTTGAAGSTGPAASSSSSATATSPLTYWITSTGRLLRIDASFGGGAPTPISLDAHTYVAFPRSGLLSS